MTDSPCCTHAVYDSSAGWWCPEHGDQTEIQLDDERRRRSELGDSYDSEEH